MLFYSTQEQEKKRFTDFFHSSKLFILKFICTTQGPMNEQFLDILFLFTSNNHFIRNPGWDFHLSLALLMWWLLSNMLSHWEHTPQFLRPWVVETYMIVNPQHGKVLHIFRKTEKGNNFSASSQKHIVTRKHACTCQAQWAPFT